MRPISPISDLPSRPAPVREPAFPMAATASSRVSAGLPPSPLAADAAARPRRPGTERSIRPRPRAPGSPRGRPVRTARGRLRPSVPSSRRADQWGRPLRVHPGYAILYLSHRQLSTWICQESRDEKVVVLVKGQQLEAGGIPWQWIRQW